MVTNGVLFCLFCFVVAGCPVTQPLFEFVRNEAWFNFGAKISDKQSLWLTFVWLALLLLCILSKFGKMVSP